MLKSWGGGSVPRQFIGSVEEGVREYLSRGPLGFPVVDVAVALYDGQYHSVDSSDAAFKTAPIVTKKRIVNQRLVANAIEPRACVARYEGATGEWTLWVTSQNPHVHRLLMCAFVLGIPEHKVRVIAPDVGGGFGVKSMLYPEDVALCVLAMRLGRPVKWIEQRREAMQASAHARDHHYAIRAGFDAAGRLLALDVRAACNAGAYSIAPWTAGIEALMAGGLLTGPYKLEHYRCEVSAVATHTTPAGPYRGVARPATTFVMERVLDLVEARDASAAQREIGVFYARIDLELLASLEVVLGAAAAHRAEVPA